MHRLPFSPSLSPLQRKLLLLELMRKYYFYNYSNQALESPWIPCLILRPAAHPAGRAGSSACSSTTALCPWLRGLSVLSQRQLSWQALLFNAHCLCILLKSFLCSPWPPFYCHFCPKCPVYSLSISLQLSLEETLAAGDFPATFTCWGLLLIWHLTPQLTQQGLNRTSILQKTHSLCFLRSQLKE